jgi:chromosome segregation ATPase
MFNLAVFSCSSIIGPIYQNTFLGQVSNLISHAKWKKNKKRYDNLKNVLEKLEQVRRDLEGKINGQLVLPDHIENMALRLLDIAECKKIILNEIKNHETGLITVDDKLAQLKGKWEERINGKSLNIEELKGMISDVELCMKIIEEKMNSLLPTMRIILS